MRGKIKIERKRYEDRERGERQREMGERHSKLGRCQESKT